MRYFIKNWGTPICILLSLLFVPALSAVPFAIAAQGNITLLGNGVEIDSFDSGDPNYSTNRIYDYNRRKDGGGVVSNGIITNSVLNVGNGNIAGPLMIGPAGSFDIGPNGSVGSLAWVSNGTKGIEAGWAFLNPAFHFPDVTLPATSWTPTGTSGSPLGGSGVAPDGNFYDHVFLAAGDYQLLDGGSIYVGSNVTVRLSVTYSGSYSPFKIYVAGTHPEVGRMTMYLAGPSAVILTDNHKTQSGYAENLIFLGLPNVTSIAYSGSTNFVGLIYAPQADFWISGGGAAAIDFVGVCVSKTVQAIGHVRLHGDENLFRLRSPLLPFPLLFGPILPARTVSVGQTTKLGISALGSLRALGATPFSYQWRFKGTNNTENILLAGATNASHSLTNIQLSDVGYYEVTITNIAGSVTSTAQLIIPGPMQPTLIPTLSTNAQFQFAVAGIWGFSYAVQSSTNLIDWISLQTNTSPYTFADSNSAAFAQRFYRAVYVP